MVLEGFQSLFGFATKRDVTEKINTTDNMMD